MVSANVSRIQNCSKFDASREKIHTTFLFLIVMPHISDPARALWFAASIGEEM
jgi:hypothetical protein